MADILDRLVHNAHRFGGILSAEQGADMEDGLKMHRILTCLICACGSMFLTNCATSEQTTNAKYFKQWQAAKAEGTVEALQRFVDTHEESYYSFLAFQEIDSRCLALSDSARCLQEIEKWHVGRITNGKLAGRFVIPDVRPRQTLASLSVADLVITAATYVKRVEGGAEVLQEVPGDSLVMIRGGAEMLFC